MVNGFNIGKFFQSLGPRAEPKKGSDESKFNFNFTPQERTLAWYIAIRAVAEAKARQQVEVDGYLIFMDLLSVHCNCCRLNLLGILMADPMTFADNVVGIGIHIDRQTGQLKDGFRPTMLERAS